jgi:hypothetical protein
LKAAIRALESRRPFGDDHSSTANHRQKDGAPMSSLKSNLNADHPVAPDRRADGPTAC